MNSLLTHPAPQPSSLPGLSDNEDSINLLELLEIVLDQRWLIAAIAAIGLALGGTYAWMATPIYEANTLIQVENSKGGGLNSLLGETGGMFATQASTAAEIEILRSRLVVGQAVSNLQLDLSVSPKYLPVVGRWLARRANEPSNPGFLGMQGYVRGNESLQVRRLDVPQALAGRRYAVVLTSQGYELRSPQGNVLGQGRPGEPLRFQDGGQAGELLVAGAVGKPGAEFYVARSPRLAATEGLQGALNIAEQRQSGMLRVSLEGADPVHLARVLNEVGALFVRQNTERKAAEVEKSLDFLNTQLPQLREQLEASETRFNQFRNQKGIFDLGNEAQLVLSQAVALQTKRYELQQRRKELETRFTPQHPAVQAVDAQIRDLDAQISTQAGRARTLPAVEQDLLRLTRDVKVNNQLYTSLLNSFQQLRLVKEGKVGNVRIIDAAVAPLGPVKPQRSRILALSGLLGLLAGLGLAFLRNSLRPGIKDPADIEARAGLHVFASVPHSEAQVLQAKDIKGKALGSHVLAVAAPEDPAVESLRSLRTALQFAMLDAANNIVLVSGPTPGIGKSFTSTNFAAVLGASGKRVLLVDADMRKGHLHQYFGLQRGHGLSELIAGSQPLAQVVQKNVAPQLDLITTGTLPPNPAELLMSPVTVQLLQTLSAQYDIVLIDTPPVLAVSDTPVLAPQAGTVFLVARAEVTTLGELQESSKRFGQSGVTVRGVIFNDLNISKRRYGYGYKYSRYRYTNYKY